MTFRKLSDQGAGPDPKAVPARQAPATDIWALFRALRDARSHFGLRPGHLQTLQAMLSFLKPGQGDTVFAGNAEICRRTGGIDERTLRRHIDRFIALGFMTRQDSPNGKRYRMRATDGRSLSFGLSLRPLLSRAEELLELAEEIEANRRDCLFLRKQVLAVLARIDPLDPENSQALAARKQLRRKLSLAEYRALLAAVETAFAALSTAVDLPETPGSARQ